jgi:hypothetical protein
MIPLRARLAFLLTAVLGLSQTRGQGGSAIITLAMPPPGGEGFAMLQDGGLFADGAASTWFNPALLADLERNTGSQAHFTHSGQDLLPLLGRPGLRQSFRGAAFCFPDAQGGTDLGIGLFHNRVRFGSERFDDSTDFSSTEKVSGLSLGIRLGLPISLGLGAKFFDSRLVPGTDLEPDFGRSRDFAFDLGLLVNPRFATPTTWKLPYVVLMPAFGISLQNLGPEVFYTSPEQADPIPRTLSRTAGLQILLADLADVQGGMSLEHEIHRRAAGSTIPVRRSGYSIGLLGYRYSRGWLDDVRGKRDEMHYGHALEVDVYRFVRLWLRLERGDFRSPPSAFDRREKPIGMGFPGLTYRMNPRLILGTRTIRGRDGGIRDGQEAFFVAVSL